jgi:hypothetical protein
VHSNGVYSVYSESLVGFVLSDGNEFNVHPSGFAFAKHRVLFSLGDNCFLWRLVNCHRHSICTYLWIICVLPWDSWSRMESLGSLGIWEWSMSMYTLH